ncbi:MAG: trigger factor [Oscillospiraceae bacterium]|nr:trigger factor [Oscillospiraceae bacterium]MBR6595200.1 trigger factor [Oscillospiraceae bacterium]
MSFTYRGLKAELQRHIVTGEEVERQLQRLQQQTPRIALVDDRPTQLGDEVVLDYAGYCDGVQFPGGTAQKQTLVLGSGSFIPGFEEQLLDKVPGEEVTVKVMFPSQYHAEELAGKAAEFRCKIHQIRIKTAYELDDVFAREVGGCETLEEMREKLGQSLQAYTDERGEMDLQDRLLRQAAATLEFTPSEKQIQAEIDEQMNNLSAQLAQQGLNLEMYCQFMSTTQEKLREDARANAEASVRIQAAIEQVVYLENMEATKEEIGEAVAVIARQNNMTLEQLKPYYDAEFEAAVVRSVLTTKVMKLVRDSAEITETADNL